MKIYIITIDEVYDYEVAPHKPLMLFSRKSVDDAIRQIKDIAKREFPKDWVLSNSKSGGFEMYLDGEYSSNHYSLSVYDYDVELTIKPELK